MKISNKFFVARSEYQLLPFYPQADQAINSCKLAILREHGYELGSADSQTICLELAYAIDPALITSLSYKLLNATQKLYMSATNVTGSPLTPARGRRTGGCTEPSFKACYAFYFLR